jgi:hypothetical protein
MLPVIKTILNQVPTTNLYGDDQYKIDRGEEVKTYTLFSRDTDGVARILTNRGYKCMDNAATIHGKKELHFRMARLGINIYIYEK